MKLTWGGNQHGIDVLAREHLAEIIVGHTSSRRGAVLLGVGRARQDHVRLVRAAVAVGAEVDLERLGRRRIDLVRAQQEQHVRAALADHLRGGHAAGPGQEPEVQAAHARGGSVQHVPGQVRQGLLQQIGAITKSVKRHI